MDDLGLSLPQPTAQHEPALAAHHPGLADGLAWKGYHELRCRVHTSHAQEASIPWLAGAEGLRDKEPHGRAQESQAHWEQPETDTFYFCL